jgi:cyanuric acid amidohydrolase
MATRQRVDVHVLPMESPGDVTELAALLSDRVRAADVVAVIGKTEGTGLTDDPDRETADHAIRATLATGLGIPVQEVGDRVSIVLSGGTPGVLSPHIAVVSARACQDAADEQFSGGEAAKRLVVGAARSRPILAEEVGRLGHVSAVSDAVRSAMAAARVERPSDVHLVLVKAPALTAASIADAERRGVDTVTTELGLGPRGAMGFANDASALGVAAALGEIDQDTLRAEDIRRDFSLYSSVAMTSSGGEKTRAEVLLFANSPHGTGPLRVGHHAMTDILDLGAVGAALANAGLPGADTGEFDPERIVYLFAKMIIPGSDRLRGQRITLHRDPYGYHVAKAMGGYLLAATTGHTMCFVSGGEHNSHQGPPDGNPLAAIVRVE